MKTVHRIVVLVVLLSVLNVTLAFAREPVRARHGMVASTNEVASRVGVEIMKRGGNAVDAAIAVAFALAVTHPAAGNLGGGGFMMIRLRDGRTTAIDYREMAPDAAHRNVYLDKNGNLIEGEGGSLVGYRAAGVPGTVRGMELALKKYGSGKLTWAQLVEPARQLAGRGFTVTNELARSLYANREYLEKYPGDEWVDVIGFDIYQRNSSNEKFIADIDKMLSTLEEIAKEKNKIPALTEFGGNLSDSSWWTGTFIKGIGNHKISYVLGWRNAGATSSGEFEYYVPYKGHTTEKDFVRFYNMQKTLFESDIKKEKLYQ